MGNGDQQGNESRDTEYIECACHDLDHLSRIWFNREDGTFYMEYKLIRFPGELPNVPPGRFQDLRIRLRDIKRYFKGIWWAIRGRPHWFDGQAEWEREEALRIASFITSKLGGWDENKRVLGQLVEALKYAYQREQEDGADRPLSIPVRTDIGDFAFHVLPGTDLGELIRDLESP